MHPLKGQFKLPEHRLQDGLWHLDLWRTNSGRGLSKVWVQFYKGLKCIWYANFVSIISRSKGMEDRIPAEHRFKTLHCQWLYRAMSKPRKKVAVYLSGRAINHDAPQSLFSELTNQQFTSYFTTVVKQSYLSIEWNSLRLDSPLNGTQSMQWLTISSQIIHRITSVDRSITRHWLLNFLTQVVSCKLWC